MRAPWRVVTIADTSLDVTPCEKKRKYINEVGHGKMRTRSSKFRSNGLEWSRGAGLYTVGELGGLRVIQGTDVGTARTVPGERVVLRDSVRPVRQHFVRFV